VSQSGSLGLAGRPLPPAVHGGLLARRDLPEHLGADATQGSAPIDLVAVNRYPFRGTAARAGVGVDNIDVEAATKRGIAVVNAPTTNIVAAAEHAWFRRTVDTAIETSDRQLETDPHKALVELRQLDTALRPLEHYPLVRSELETARKRVLLACLKVAMEEVEDLLGKKQFVALVKRQANKADPR